MKNYSEIENIVREYASENMRLYPNDWNVNLTYAKDQIIFIAKLYLENRTEQEAARDKKADIGIEDYQRWISWEWCNWINENKDWSEIKTVQDLFEWSGIDLENDCDFNRDLVSDEIFHPDFPLVHEDDNINFNFKIVKDDKWDSVIEFMFCETI